jgi:hypothetical protein
MEGFVPEKYDEILGPGALNLTSTLVYQLVLELMMII